MKNLKAVLIILFALVIIILIFFLVKNINNNKNTSQNEKMISEINYMDRRLTSLINGVNNIALDNYKIAVTKTSASSNQSSKSDTSSSGGEEKNTNQNTTSTTPEKYELKADGILKRDNEVDWDKLKNEIETIYTVVPTMTLDLYNMNISQEDILNFNKELDDLTIAIKNKDKDNTLIKLANLYRYLPAYASNFSNDSKYISSLETKSNVFKAYVFVNIDNWDEASNYINKSIESFSRALNNIQEKNSYNTNKIYIILNEIQSSVNIKDKDVFLIKYKNFIEETENQVS